MAAPVSPEAGPELPPEVELPEARLFWRWVWRSVRAYLGWILVAVGAVFIVVGYLGVSREALVAKQIPYLVSGGIFGLGLIVLGTFYLYSEDLRRDSRRINRLERMITELHAVLLTRAGAPSRQEISEAVATLEAKLGGSEPAGRENGQASRKRAAATLLALPDSQRFHRPDCRMVEGKPGATQVTADDIRERQLEPCGMCEPVVHIQV